MCSMHLLELGKARLHLKYIQAHLDRHHNSVIDLYVNNTGSNRILSRLRGLSRLMSLHILSEHKETIRTVREALVHA